MHFDARAAKLLKPGEHLIVGGCPGLRLEVSATRKTWTYRYKSVGSLMKQVALGQWPAMSVQVAVVKWQELRDRLWRLAGALLRLVAEGKHGAEEGGEGRERHRWGGARG